MSKLLPVLLLVALSAAQKPSECPICRGSGDPKTVVHGEAPRTRTKPGASRESRATTGGILLGGELWNGWRGGEYWVSDRDDTGELLDLVHNVKPDIMHASIFGPELLTGIHSGGEIIGLSPVFPKGLTTVRDYLGWWKAFIKDAHRAGVKVQATFGFSLLWDDEAGSKGWLRYYNDYWEADLLGPKPRPNPVDLLQKDAAGKPLRLRDERLVPGLYSYKGCPNNPHWRQLMKRFVRVGIEAGFDGFMVQGLFRDDCHCRYCLRAFREFLLRRYSAGTLRDRFGIDISDASTIKTTRGHLPGLLAIEARRFNDSSLKQAFDDVFAKYGRSLKRDLLLSIWTHQRNFLANGAGDGDITDERAFLPAEEWGAREDYLWYCLGQTGSRLADRDPGDASLTAKFIYSMGRGKPFVLQKYDYVRPRLTLSEAWANGGIGLALNAAGYRQALDPYFAFHRRYRDLYRLARPLAEVGIIFPRRALLSGDNSFLPEFRQAARRLIEDHRLFDIIIDQHLSTTDLSFYRDVIAPDRRFLPGPDRRLLAEHKPQPRTPLSGADAPWTVQMHAWRQPGRTIVHLLNYDRDEQAAGLENPRASKPFRVQLNLPKGVRASRCRFVTPEQPDPRDLPIAADGGQTVFEAPEFLVYGVVIIDYESP